MQCILEVLAKLAVLEWIVHTQMRVHNIIAFRSSLILHLMESSKISS